MQEKGRKLTRGRPVTDRKCLLWTRYIHTFINNLIYCTHENNSPCLKEVSFTHSHIFFPYQTIRVVSLFCFHLKLFMLHGFEIGWAKWQWRGTQAKHMFGNFNGIVRRDYYCKKTGNTKHFPVYCRCNQQLKYPIIPWNRRLFITGNNNNSGNLSLVSKMPTINVLPKSTT